MSEVVVSRESKYHRKGATITRFVTADDGFGTGREVEKYTYRSINAAKRASRKIQAEHRQQFGSVVFTSELGSPPKASPKAKLPKLTKKSRPNKKPRFVIDPMEVIVR